MPFSPTLKAPGDRRRFVAYAEARNLPFELARFDQHYDVVVLSEIADISIWSDYQQGKIVFDFIDSLSIGSALELAPAFARSPLVRASPPQEIERLSLQFEGDVPPR